MLNYLSTKMKILIVIGLTVFTHFALTAQDVNFRALDNTKTYRIGTLRCRLQLILWSFLRIRFED
jgi:hypothetical protein